MVVINQVRSFNLMQGYIGVSDQRKRIVVVFRSSDQAADFRNDVDVLKEPIAGLNSTSSCAGVEVMRGIHRPWSAVHSDVITQLKDLTTKYPNYAIGITGHSLGGSITYLGFPVLAQLFADKEIIASPLNAFPIGNETFANMTTKLLSRTRVIRRGTEHGDSVPAVFPLNLPFSPFPSHHHVPTLSSLSPHNPLTINRTCTPSLPTLPLRHRILHRRHPENHPGPFRSTRLELFGW
jgi:hypothetical protein